MGGNGLIILNIHHRWRLHGDASGQGIRSHYVDIVIAVCSLCTNISHTNAFRIHFRYMLHEGDYVNVSINVNGDDDYDFDSDDDNSIIVIVIYRYQLSKIHNF